jgi:hypothetical protein
MEPLDDTDLLVKLGALNWDTITAQLDDRGYATTPAMLSPGQCKALASLYPMEKHFRSKVIMESHAFGRGEYQYFAYPLPPVVRSLRQHLYPHLVPIAQRWAGRLGSDETYPNDLNCFLARCHRSGQIKPTPLILRYETDDYNRLHQDLYGEIAFPIQLTLCLSQPGGDFSGGEFLLTEQRPRTQTRADVINLEQGEAVIFATRYRPVKGVRAYYRVNHRHGVSRLRSGTRYSLGIIFHDAA